MATENITKFLKQANNLCLILMVVFTASNLSSAFAKVADLSSNDVQCNFSLIIPEGCFTEKGNSNQSRTRVDFTVLKFRFNAKSEIKSKNGVEAPEFCEFEEVLDFPENCIEQNKSVVYSELVRCTKPDSIELSGPAIWVAGSVYRKYGASYREDTTGLVMECISKELLQLRTADTVEFSGIGVKLGKIASPVKQSNLNPQAFNNWIQIQVPKNFKSGIIQDYHSNYSLFSLDKDHKEIQIKNIELIIKNPVSTTNNVSKTIRIEFRPTGVSCTASSNDNIYLAAIGGQNPVETQILYRCLPRQLDDCELKVVGTTCWQNRPCSIMDIKTMEPNGIIFCSHPKDGSLTKEYFTGLDVFMYDTDPHTEIAKVLIDLKVEDGKTLVRIVEEDEPEAEDLKIETMTFYEKETVNFECQYLPYVLVPSVIWQVRFSNQSVLQIHTSELNSEDIHDEELEAVDGELRNYVKIKSAKFKLTMTTDIKEISCSASFWDSADFVSSTIELHVLESQIPTFTEKSLNEDPLEVDAGQSFSLTCQTESSAPHPSYEWTYNGEKITSNENCIKIINDSSTNSSYLSICNAGKSHEGTFTCRATNFLGWNEKQFQVKVNPLHSNAWIYFGISCALIALLLPMILALYRIYLTQRTRLSALEITAFENGDEKELKRNRFAHENAQFLPYDRDYEIPWSDVEIDEDDYLGEGAFGLVVKGIINGRPVAAKSVRPTAEKSTVLALLSELKIMIYLGKHPNIVELVGACTSMLKQGRPYVFIEFCENGDFHSFLLARRPNFVHQFRENITISNVASSVNISPIDSRSIGTNATANLYENHFDSKDLYENFNSTDSSSVEMQRAIPNNYDALRLTGNPTRKVSTLDLLQWAADIANGMEYLESKKVIHGDLAARNVLVTASFGIKITDFGLSRQLQKNYAQYVKQQMGALPWRWMAIESLFDMVFTSKSDVWAFGVTVWEMFTLAEVPFPEFNWTYEFMEQLKANLRPPKPHFANDQIYKILLDCWKSDPQSRPSFTHLKNAFAHLSSSGGHRNYLSLET